MPGTCRKGWQLCSRTAPAGVPRCEACELDLAQHPDGRIRLAMVQEGTVSMSTLDLMANDDDASVANLAKTAAYRVSHRIERPPGIRAPVNAGAGGIWSDFGAAAEQQLAAEPTRAGPTVAAEPIAASESEQVGRHGKK